MIDIGVLLKKAREAKGIDLDYIYQKTKIHSKVIKALEANDFEYFTSRMYLRSFLKKYADFLNLDSKSFLEELEENVSPKTHGKKEPLAITSVAMLTVQERVFLTVKIVVLFFIVAASIYLVSAGINRVITVIFPPQNKVIKNISKKEVKQKIPKAEEKKDIEKEILQNEIKGTLELTLEAEEDCWIQLRSDNVKIFDGILKQGKKESWKAENEFELNVGNASVLKYSLNGSQSVYVGRGIIKGIKINSKGLRFP